MIGRALLVCMALVLAAPALAQPAVTSWQGRIRPEDRPRIAGLWNAWTRSLNQIETAGQGDALRVLGKVAVPPVEPLPGHREVRMTTGPALSLPAAGTYRCRLLQLGARDDGWASMPPPLSIGDWGPCTLAPDRDDTLQLKMAEGVQRIGGRVWPDGDRMVFLGALSLASENGRRAYGDDPDRDSVGVLRPLGPDHWRLELPWPQWQSNLMLVEIRAG